MLGAAVAALTLSACGGGGGGGGDDAPLPDLFPDVPVDERLTFDGLSAQVDVVVDDRGMPHIYATTVEDALFAQGYLMSRDRFPQMEFIRRSTLGRLAEVVGSLDDGIVSLDALNRLRGFGRRGRAAYEALEPDSPARRYAEAFVAGVNAYVAEVQAGTAEPDPNLDQLALIFLYASENFGPWAPEDVFALASFQAYELANELEEDVDFTLRRDASEAAFPAGAVSPPARALRRGWFADVLGLWPGRRSYTLDGFPNVGEDGGTRALLPPAPSPAPTGAPARLADLLGPGARPALRKARRTLSKMAALRREILGSEFSGSNNWVVSGEHTDTGLPLLANDPHLELTSPAIWWYVHLNTARRGGDLDVQGVAFVGIPGVVIGHNRHLAWGVTTANYDVTDVYLEDVTPGEGDEPTTVRFRGDDVPVEIVEETIERSNADPVTLEIEVVPHHGPIVPDFSVDDEGGLVVDPGYTPDGSGGFRAVSTRYTGDEPTNELGAFIGLWTAETVDEVETALDAFEVGAQAFVVATRTGETYLSTQARVPVRAEGSCTWGIDPETRLPSGIGPFFVLPGDGGFEWVEPAVSDRFLPHALDPARGYLATANQDLVGVTDDGTPCNDPHYLGWDFAPGWRHERIASRLAELVAGGGVSADDLAALQADTRSQLGPTLRDILVAALDRADEEYAAGGTHPDLGGVVADAPGRRDDLADVRTRLAEWSFATPHAWQVDDDPMAVADSIATTLFEVTLSRLAVLTFADEIDEQARAVDAPFSDVAPDNLETMEALERLLCWGPDETVLPSCTAIDPAPLATYDPARGHSILFDDMRTDAVQESRDERVVRAVLATLELLEADLGPAPADWRWWKLHDVRFEAIIPASTVGSDDDILSIPADGSDFPNDAYPRDGGFGAVDVCNWKIWPDDLDVLDPDAALPYPTSFRCAAGPSMRMVATIRDDGVDAINSLPGGQSIFPGSPRRDDEAELWWRNIQPPLAYDDDEVAADSTRRLRFGAR